METQKAPQATTIKSYSNFLIDCLESYDLNNLSLCGHSMGGLIALEMAMQKNFPVQSIILVNSIYPTKLLSRFLQKQEQVMVMRPTLLLNMDFIKDY